MRIGYACLAVGVSETEQKTCRLKNAGEARLRELIFHNLTSLENIIDYNIKKKIKLFRISSDLIPFGSSPANTLPWQDIYSSFLLRIGSKIKNSGMRVSMHPGQYTVLNSPDEVVVNRAIADLQYHAKLLDSLGVGSENKIVLHVGGMYNNKEQAKKRFIENYHTLDDGIKQRLVLENDDKSYNICDVLEIGDLLQTPVIFDNLHHKINPCDEQKSDADWIELCRSTWQKEDGRQKIHYSQQDPAKRAGSHAESIAVAEFQEFCATLKNIDIDIMLEVKDKNVSALKCIREMATAGVMIS